MKNAPASKNLARIVGTLFITGTVAGILSVVVTGDTLISNDVAAAASNDSQVIIGTLLVLLMGFALALIPVLLYPLFRTYSQTLAMAAVLFRGALEAVGYIAIALSWLLLLTLSREFTQAADPNAAHFQTLLSLTQASTVWLTHILAIVFSLGALIIYYLFYRTKLIPDWLSTWGLSGAVLYMAAPILALFDVDLPFLMAPLALQEMVLAVWLIVKGFSPQTTH
jgi:hypothetical protein